jgi:hypothetical protein
MEPNIRPGDQVTIMEPGIRPWFGQVRSVKPARADYFVEIVRHDTGTTFVVPDVFVTVNRRPRDDA